MERQLPLEEDSLLRGKQILMKERMHRAQMEVSLFSIAMMNFCEALNTTSHSREPCCSKNNIWRSKFVPSHMAKDAVHGEHCQVCEKPSSQHWSLSTFKCYPRKMWGVASHLIISPRYCARRFYSQPCANSKSFSASWTPLRGEHYLYYEWLGLLTLCS